MSSLPENIPTRDKNNTKILVPLELIININEILKMMDKERLLYQEQLLLLKKANLKLRENELKIVRAIRIYMENIKTILSDEESIVNIPIVPNVQTVDETQDNTPSQQITHKISDYLCQICLDTPRDCLLEPCMHFCVCQACVNKITDRKCPICRRDVDYYQNVFIS